MQQKRQNIRLIIRVIICNKIKFFILPLFILQIVAGCGEDKRDNVQYSFGINLPLDSKGIKYTKMYANPDYKRPYNIYVKFSSDSVNVEEFIRKLGLVSNKDDFYKLLCLERIILSFQRNYYNTLSGI